MKQWQKSVLSFVIAIISAPAAAQDLTFAEKSYAGFQKVISASLTPVGEIALKVYDQAFDQLRSEGEANPSFKQVAERVKAADPALKKMTLATAFCSVAMPTMAIGHAATSYTEIYSAFAKNSKLKKNCDKQLSVMFSE